MVKRLHPALKAQEGFTLIELLVVVLIIGILAALAIPSFLNQKGKANDASAKELARTGETAAETYATDHSGGYAGISTAELQSIEPTIQTAAGKGNAYISAVTETGSGSGYEVTTTAAQTSDKFTVKKLSSGAVERTCEGTGGGCNSSTKTW